MFFFKDENAACILIYLICCKARNIQEQLEIHKRHEETALLTNEIAFQKFEKTHFYEPVNRSTINVLETYKTVSPMYVQLYHW